MVARYGRNIVAGIAPAVAIVGFLSAVVAVEGVSTVVAIVVLSGLLYPVTVRIVGRAADPDDQRFLTALLLWAIGVRFLAFGVVRGFIDPVLLAPDAITYENGGWAIAEMWAGRGVGLPDRIAGSIQVAYFYTNAVLFTLFGRVPEAVAVVNLFMSVWTVAVMYRLARLVAPARPAIAKISALLFAFFPSIVLWSVLNIREAPMIFLLTAAILIFLRLQNGKAGPIDVPLLIATLGAMVFYRQYMAALVGGACLVGLFVSLSRSPQRAALLGGGFMILVALTAQSFGVVDEITADPTLAGDEIFQTAQMLREDMARGAGSAFVQGTDVSTLGGAISFLPVGLTYFLLAPFPWALGSLLQVITLPETLVWYALLPFGLVGIFHSLRRRLLATVIPLMVILTVSFSYALVQGNVGTAYRHRAQILPLLFVMIATGLVLWSERRQARRNARASRRAEARAQLRVRPGG